MTEQVFLNGLIFKLPRENAPEFVKGSLSIKREELIETLKTMGGDWIRLDLKVSKEGKAYAQVNDWKPEQESIPANVSGSPVSPDDDLPF